MMDRKASEDRKKLMDWDNRKDRGTRDHKEDRDSQAPKRGGCGGRNSGKKKKKRRWGGE